MIDRWSQVIALANSFSFVGASGCCRNLSTQIGASASTTAVCARSLATRSAVSWSVHPKIEKPSTHTMAAPITAPQIPGLRLGGNVTDLMNHALPAPQWGIAERSELSVRQAIRATTYAIACGEERHFASTAISTGRPKICLQANHPRALRVPACVKPASLARQSLAKPLSHGPKSRFRGPRRCTLRRPNLRLYKSTVR